MRNCLKTQLKEVVNNDNLSYLGGIRLKAAGDIDYPNSYFTVNFDTSVEGVSADWIDGSSQSIEKSGTAITVRTPNEVDDTLLIIPKYDIVGINMFQGNGKVYLKDLSGLSKLTHLRFGIYNTEDIAQMPTNLPLQVLVCGYISGDIKHLNNYPTLTTIACSFIGSDLRTKLSGNLNSLTALVNLTGFVVPKDVQGYLSSLTCEDTLESFYNETKMGNVDADASLWANKFKKLMFVQARSTSLVWSSPTLRSANYPIVNVYTRFATSTDCDNYLINMATCLDNGLYTRTDKTINIMNGIRTSASDAAVAKFETAGWTINGVTKE